MKQDPTEVIDKYGADALRLYLINRCVLRVLCMHWLCFACSASHWLRFACCGLHSH